MCHRNKPAPDDATKLQVAQDNINFAGGCLRRLMVIAFIVMYHIGVERGKKHNNPHNQGAAQTSSARTVDDTKKYLEAMLREALGYEKGCRRVPEVSLHFLIELRGTQTILYLFGYTWKDRDEPEWYVEDGDGFEPQFRTDAIERCARPCPSAPLPPRPEAP